MEDVKWLEVTLDTTEAELDALCARLTGNGVTGLAIEDEEDFKTFLEQNHQYWDYVDDGLLARMKGVCRVKFYITDDADGRKQLEGWLAGIDQPYSLASLGDNDCAHSWQKYYKPMPVGERLYIVPEWERGEPVPAGKAPLYLNPGLTFGTGSHASTQLCLMGLEQYTVPGKPVLDLGCGSGILSIAALALGASEAMAVDIDPKMCIRDRCTRLRASCMAWTLASVSASGSITIRAEMPWEMCIRDRRGGASCRRFRGITTRPSPEAEGEGSVCGTHSAALV